MSGEEHTAVTSGRGGTRLQSPGPAQDAPRPFELIAPSSAAQALIGRDIAVFLILPRRLAPYCSLLAPR